MSYGKPKHPKFKTEDEKVHEAIRLLPIIEPLLPLGEFSLPMLLWEKIAMSEEDKSNAREVSSQIIDLLIEKGTYKYTRPDESHQHIIKIIYPKKIESFNEKCDKILTYLKQQNEIDASKIITWQQLSAAVNILSDDSVIQFLLKKEYILGNSHDVRIMPAGISFISNNSFSKIEISKNKSHEMELLQEALANSQKELTDLQIKEIKGKKKWSVIGAIGGIALVKIVDNGKDILQFLSRLFHK